MIARQVPVFLFTHLSGIISFRYLPAVLGIPWIPVHVAPAYAPGNLVCYVQIIHARLMELPDPFHLLDTVLC